MTTLKQISDDIINSYYGGVPGDDSDLSETQVMKWIIRARATILRQELTDHKAQSSFISWVPCVRMELVNPAECCGFETDCKVLRSVKKIPRTINLGTKSNYITSVTSVPTKGFNNITQFDEIGYLAAKHDSGSRYTSKRPKWFLLDDYLYIISGDNLAGKLVEKVSIYGIFEDLEDLAKLGDCEDKPCFDPNSTPFPLSEDLVGNVVKMIIAEKFPVLKNTRTDNANTANEEKETPSR